MKARIPVLTCLLALAASCASTMSIRSMQPGRVFVGSTNHLTIFDGQGRRSAREFVNNEIMSQSRTRGYFSVADRSEEGYEVRIAGRRATIEGGQGDDGALGDREAGLRIDVLEWNGFRDEEEVFETGHDGVVYATQAPVLVGSVLLAITLFDASGNAFLAETEYEGSCSTFDMDMPREAVIEEAASQAISYFLNDITPVPVVTRVKLDDEDPGQEFILDTARGGSVALAARDMRAYFDSNPLNASAAYNLAVFLEAMGEYHQAIEFYDKAISLGGKDFYHAGRAGCARRLSSSDSLSGEYDFEF